MQEVRRFFNKAGGLKLLKQYWRNRVLSTAVAQFLLLGKSRTALELLRQSVALKTKQRLSQKYSKALIDFDTQWTSSEVSKQERKVVWLFWWQGEEEMPALVKKCIASVHKNFMSWEVVLLTSNNYLDYVSFPDYINEKFEKRIITLTHFSDLLRLELLNKYGGLWLDATVYCSSNDIPKSILNSEMFVYRPQKPGADGNAITISSWLIWAKTNCKILAATRYLLYKYWQTNNYLCDYFLLHFFFSIVLDFYKEEAKKIPPFCNSVPHILLLHLFDKFDEHYWNDLKRMTCFHKLSYKLQQKDMGKSGTYYDIIIKS